jgi:enoyl-CoA hydratase/carnithine racemase
MTALLISTENVKRLGLVNENVNDKLIAVAIRRVQDLKLQEALTTPLYTVLMQKVVNNDVSGVYADLMNDYVAPCMVAYVDAYVAIFSNSKITNKTTGAIQDNNIRPAGNELVDFTDKLEKQAMFYAQRLIDYLETGVIAEYTPKCNEKKSGYQFNWI